jgi:hypothetical protein
MTRSAPAFARTGVSKGSIAMAGARSARSAPWAVSRSRSRKRGWRPHAVASIYRLHLPWRGATRGEVLWGDESRAGRPPRGRSGAVCAAAGGRLYLERPSPWPPVDRAARFPKPCAGVRLTPGVPDHRRAPGAAGAGGRYHSHSHSAGPVARVGCSRSLPVGGGGAVPGTRAARVVPPMRGRAARARRRSCGTADSWSAFSRGSVGRRPLLALVAWA